MENPARFGEAIYAREGEALDVNLLIASTVAWPEKGLVLSQETRFPDEPATRLTLRLAKPARLALRLRHPAWADSMTTTVNGTAAPLESRPGSFAELAREWKDGDTVEVRLPMRLRFEPFADDPSRGAFVYGPIVLAADLGTKGLDDRIRYGVQAPEDWRSGAPVVPVLVAHGREAALSRVKAEDPRWAERFELYAGGLELANGFSELTDAAEQRARLVEEQALRARLGRPVYPLDEPFLEAVGRMPPAGGVAVGLDRVLMLLTGAESIEDVLLFPASGFWKG
jgi:hypothetical protein